MKRILLIAFFVAAVVTWGDVRAQEKTVSGRVTSSDNGEVLPGVNVVVKGTTTGTVTDADGSFSLSTAGDGTLVFTFIGYGAQEIAIGNRTTIDVAMSQDAQQLSEVVVTALGIERQKASLGYAVQEVSGSEVNKVKEASFISSLSGKVAGLAIKKSNSLGGSINAVVRGTKSFTGNNQVLFVVDGVPISNSTLNTTSQMTSGGGYDYGNAASDIDPETIENISVLKGATAAALYGSEAANGVIMITTKKGTKRDGVGITLNHSTTFSQYDKSTFGKYQKEYGAGYGPTHSPGSEHPGLARRDFDGDGVRDWVAPTDYDGSFGEAFDENLLVYQWEAFFPQLDSYGKPTPWVAAEHGPEHIFQTGVNNITSVSLTAGNEHGGIRLGYTNDNRTGILPNSELSRNIIDFNASYNLSKKLRIEGKATYTRNEGKGRYGTGYDGRNVMQTLRQWFQSNVDLERQKQAYMKTRENISWNASSISDPSPAYSDNLYWTLYENYETDKRNRFFGKFQLTYDINDWLNFMVRSGMDTYSDLQEERTAVGSQAQSRYAKFQRTFEEYNNDFIFSVKKDFSDAFSFNGLLGASVKNRRINSTRAQTNGGLVLPRMYSLSNSRSTLRAPTEEEIHVRKYGAYGQLSFGYKNMLYLDATGRVDRSSTLPEGNNTYFYPSTSLSFLFSEILNVPVISLGKARLSYAKVSGDAPSYSILNTYTAGTPFGSTPLYYLGNVTNNPNLKPESTNEVEAGLEMNFLNNRAGFELSYYKKNTVDQILPAEVSSSTGFTSKYVNAGEMENKGVEVSAFGFPVKKQNFSWKVNVNWTRNRNTVVSLSEGSENLLIFSNWSSAINARVGEPYGTITGSNYVYHENGGRLVGSDGKYIRSESTTEVIGNIQPDWAGGINNVFTYKNISFNFLIDMQRGGDIYSYDIAFGNATGLYAETAALNDKGIPVRTRVADGGGILLPGVQADGSPNTIYARGDSYLTPLGYYGGSTDNGAEASAPDAQFVYDASFIKLREVALTYSLPKSVFGKLPLNNVSLSVYGRNLWIIDKNLPYGDPEYNVSAGNLQGIQNAALPSVKEYGFNVNIQF